MTTAPHMSSLFNTIQVLLYYSKQTWKPHMSGNDQSYYGMVVPQRSMLATLLRCSYTPPSLFCQYTYVLSQAYSHTALLCWCLEITQQTAYHQKPSCCPLMACEISTRQALDRSLPIYWPHQQTDWSHFPSTGTAALQPSCAEAYQ